jgi:hypothetical protein
MESSNISPLTVNKSTVSLLQKVVWAPTNNETDAGKSQAIAFVHKYDIFYKPRVEEEAVYRITTTGESILWNFFHSLNKERQMATLMAQTKQARHR